MTKDDKLSITVGSKNPELVIPFNIGVGSYALNADGAVASAMSGTTSIRERGYVLDKNGEIEFPIIGKIKAEGLTTKEYDVIKNSLIKNGLVSDPMNCRSAESENHRIGWRWVALAYKPSRTQG